MQPVEIKVSYEKKSREIIIDPKVFKECHPKEVKVWKWKYMKYITYIVHYKKGKYEILMLD